MEMKRLIPVVLIVACVGGVLGALITLHFFKTSDNSYTSIDARQKMVLANYQADTAYEVPEGMDFRAAANRTTAAIVHIKTSFGAGNFSVNPLQYYLDSPARSSGSGVLVSDDGYVVTNNHVIEDATNIEVVMNDNQRFYAKLVGADPSTDLALLKVKGQNLPFVKYGDSDKVEAGEWVLAIGNPFDLNSTVTAGIVSAKARNIGILRDRNNLQVESFIQTDAAVNPGNSGGALVNLKGELIGINTAIATTTGSYQGYSFAIPVSLVTKVIDDLLEFGSVQRGLLGIQIQDVNARVAEELNLSTSLGVLINKVNDGSAAAEAGLAAGDVIDHVNNHPVRSVSELQELVARHRPGTEIEVMYVHDGVKHTSRIRLKNYQGTRVMEHKETRFEFDGATFETVPYAELNKLGLEGGVRIAKLNQGKWKEANIPEGFILTYIDRVPVENVEDLNMVLNFKNGAILLEGYLDGTQKTFGLDW